MCLGQALLPLIGDSEATVAALDRFKAAYPVHFEAAMAKKLGFAHPPGQSALRECLNTVLGLLAQERSDYTVFWRALTRYAEIGDPAAALDQVVNRDAFARWLLSFSELHAQYGRGPDANLMQRINPRFVLRNYMAQEAIAQAQEGNFATVQALYTVLSTPFDEHPAYPDWAQPAPAWAADIELSCSS